MCGIAGFWTREALPRDELRSRLGHMVQALAHRGPDGAGHWMEPRLGVALGHRRLSVIDLQDRARQPMVSSSGRWTVSFNGEIYNFEELRRDVRARGSRLRTTSDTEALVESLEHHGAARTLDRLQGMFAIAAWDAREHRLWLIRDRMGIKPLFWAQFGSTVLFASELGALRLWPTLPRGVDPQALASLVRYLYVSGPRTILGAVRRLQPGSLLRIDDPRKRPSPQTWWSLRGRIEEARTDSDHAPDIDELEHLLRDSVRMRMTVSDVPVGLFLSGGIDSSLISSLAAENTSAGIEAFSVGFSDPDFDESRWATQVAEHIGCRLHIVRLEAATAFNLLQDILLLAGEPFADPSLLPTMLVSRTARHRVKVVLTGDGADELFGGYARYRWVERMINWSDSIPAHLLRAATLLGASSVRRTIRSILDRGTKTTLGRRLEKTLLVQELRDPLERYRTFNSRWPCPADLLHPELCDAAQPKSPVLSQLEPIERFMLEDCEVYLVDDILTKVDRASMTFGLEARVPYLDHRIVELAWRWPLRKKAGREAGKLPLRDLLHRRFPRRLFDRPKHGFGAPLAGWLRREFREWAEEMLSSKSLIATGFFKDRPVRLAWQRHLRGANEASQLWPILMAQAWALTPPPESRARSEDPTPGWRSEERCPESASVSDQ